MKETKDMLNEMYNKSLFYKKPTSEQGLQNQNQTPTEDLDTCAAIQDVFNQQGIALSKPTNLQNTLPGVGQK